MISPDRFENGQAMLLAGLEERYSLQTRVNIPSLWAKFGPSIGKVPGQVGQVSYGATWNSDADCNFDYMAAVEVKDSAGLPTEFSTLDVTPQRYVVFHHTTHVSSIADTLAAIWSEWVPRSGHPPAPSPCLERYDERFDPRTGLGGFEIWIPIQA